MSRQFKVGDLALTLCSGYGFASMSTVQLEMFLEKGQKAQQPGGQLWTAPFSGWVVFREGEDGFGFFRPSNLMPLRGNFAPTEQKAREVIA